MKTPPGVPGIVLAFVYYSIFLLVPATVSSQELSFDREKVFDEVWTLVRDEFFDAAAVDSMWDSARENFRPKALATTSHDQFADVVSEMLETLQTSHTHYFSANNPKRYQLLGVFDSLVPDDQKDLLEFDSIGIETATIDGKIFVRGVLDGFPADKQGIRFGDEIVSVDGREFHPVESFRGRESVLVELRRSIHEKAERIAVEVERLNGRTMFEVAMENSARTYEIDGKSVAYVHVWSYAGAKYQEALKNLLLFGKLNSCDALVLDLRDGWGGASIEYLGLFREPVVSVVSTPRRGERFNYSGVWGKPVVLLVNEQSTSGKELFAYGFKKLKLGEVAGVTTAGAVVAGKATLLSNGDVLYVAVSDIEVDGTRLEGKGVSPTIEVARPIPYANGADPQLDKALEIAREKLR